MKFLTAILVLTLYLFETGHSFPANDAAALLEVNDVDLDLEQRFDNMDERGEYFEGDIVLDEEDLVQAKAGIKDTSKRWPNNQIIYKIDGSFSSGDRDTINKAIKEITDKTCITFKVRTTEADYVSVTNSNGGCYSNIGRSKGKQTLNLGRGCVYKMIPAHEFIHALGFFHEQSRTDRDDFVTIDLENVQKGYEGNFDKYDSKRIDPYGVTYDYGSVMHYSKGAFAKDTSKPTIIVKQKDATIGQRNVLSDKDAQKIKNMYGCPK